MANIKYLSPLGLLFSSGGDGGKKRGDAPPERGRRFRGQSYKRGGRVKRTGKAKLHKGERVLTKKQAKRYRRKR